MYKRRNEIERLSRLLKGFQRRFSRFEKTRCHVRCVHQFRVDRGPLMACISVNML